MSTLHQERDDIAARPLLLSTVVVLAAIALSLGVVALLDGGRTTQIDKQTPAASPFPSSQPIRSERDRLRPYGWVDRAHGVVHVPIDVAAKLYLEERARRARQVP
jgi:hypothetical protein